MFFLKFIPPQQLTVCFRALHLHARPGAVGTRVRWRRCGVGLLVLLVVCFETEHRQLAVVTLLSPFPHLNLIAHLKRAIITFLILSGDPRLHFMLVFYVNQLR